tara:strand:+ start:121 stop:375 length:255 start_codon:yes stop_codon:yes gene_type:complete
MLLSPRDDDEQFFTAYIDTKTNNVILRFTGFENQEEAEIFLREFVEFNNMPMGLDSGSVHLVSLPGLLDYSAATQIKGKRYCLA